MYKYLLFFTISLAGTVQAQGLTYNLGRAPTDAEIQAWDIAIRPDGLELPTGSGTAKQGALSYSIKCIACHGSEASGAGAPRLVGRNTVVANWPFATSLWNYINRAMPLNMEGSLTNDEVYAITAYLLFKGSVIGEDDILDKESLPKVEMLNKEGYVPPPIDQWEPGMPRLFKILP